VPKLNTNQHGFSLIEVLVALVVLSVGMLGMAGMYVTTLRSGGDSISRVKAIYLVSDMVDRIRANPSPIASATYAAGVAGAAAACQATQCTIAQMAQEDLRVWQSDVNSLLPGGIPTVTVDPTTTPATYTVTIVWTDAGSTAQTYGVVTQL
jgi:type IV pilus assembly protein PilV